jgi:serine phosphatase RsbU (regulator of sigma subunit)
MENSARITIFADAAHAAGSATLAADDPGNDEPDLGTTVLIRNPTSSGGTEDGRAHYLAVVAGERAGLRVELGAKPVVIGRVPPADLVIDDSKISRKHCRISLVLDEVYVADLGSSNGTMVDGRRLVNPAPLPPGARLQIGGHILEHEYRSRKEVEASKELDRDLESARRYVQSLIPAPLVEGPIRTEWVLLPSARLGGDVFGYHQLDARTFAIFLLDVSGHGTGAAMHAVSVINILRRDALPGVDMRDPAKVAAYVNTLFQMNTHGGMYLTMWYGVYDMETRILRYCSAGHHPSYLVAEAREGAVPLKTPNIMIGATSKFEFESASVEVPPGSRLYVFSDGIYEFEAKDGQQWTLEHVLPLIVEPLIPGVAEPERLLEAIRGHARDADFDDDFTVLVATFL